MFSSTNRFRLSMESLEVRETPSASGGALDLEIPSEDVNFQTKQTRQSSVVVDLATDIPDGSDATGDGRKYKMLVAPLVLDTDVEAVRHRMFAIVDRTQATEENVAPGGNDSIWVDPGTEGQTAQRGTYSWAYLTRRPRIHAG